jgi:hypothetical protein
MKNINQELPEFIQKLEDRLKEKGHSNVSVKTQYTPSGVDILFVANEIQLLDKYTIFNNGDHVSFIRTIFV